MVHAYGRTFLRPTVKLMTLWRCALPSVAGPALTAMKVSWQDTLKFKVKSHAMRALLKACSASDYDEGSPSKACDLA